MNFVLAREVTFHATIIERSYFPVVLLTDIMFSAFAYMGVPMKALPGPCRDLIELTADRLAPPQLVEEFWELWTNTKWPDLDRLLRGVKIQDVADPFGSNLAHLLMLGAHGLSENRTMHRLHSDGVVDHLENSIAGRGIELLLRGLLARAKGRGLGFHHDRNDWLRDKWLKSRFPKTRYASEDVEITFGHDKSDKSRFFVVDALAWLLSKCVNQSFDAENSNHRIFRKVLGKPNFSIAEGAITRFNAKNTIDANWQIVKDHDVFSALLRDYRSSLNAS
ncbi:hypothetical protein BOSEA31B_20394 [Hyphomicrobiales bacterium]|nr:hypothetical protein BOSEA31B_20394 [Hyphomicrobiales bacterium]CAH1702230.1 hypothetical protein BOSEA1005_30102 [Hyphomicrobiales bacterium]CAI0346433.1 hypothetical protein BO1005MUT1_510074 [Hyphomicrobiales bacterium]